MVASPTPCVGQCTLARTTHSIIRCPITRHVTSYDEIRSMDVFVHSAFIAPLPTSTIGIVQWDRVVWIGHRSLPFFPWNRRLYTASDRAPMDGKERVGLLYHRKSMAWSSGRPPRAGVCERKIGGGRQRPVGDLREGTAKEEGHVHD